MEFSREPVATKLLPRLGLLVTALGFFSSCLHAAVTLPRVFGDNMVLQRNTPIPVWGKAAPGEKVLVAFAGQKKTTTAGENGLWQLTLDPLKASKAPQSLVVSGENKLTLENVLVGEVWLCSGQSNMEWTVSKAADYDAEKVAANFHEIRHFKVPRIARSFPQRDLKGEWLACSPETVGGFTAVGYFFAREISKKLDVPIGLLHSSWGGTAIEPWTSPEGILAVPELSELNAKLANATATSPEGRKLHEAYLADLKKWSGESEAAIAAGRPLNEPPAVPWFAGDNPQPTQLYNGMIRPFAPYAIRGAIWYQGEANGFEDIVYKNKLRALIGGWRSAWGRGDFPFYIVQLSNYANIDPADREAGKNWAKLREAQLEALEIPNTGLAVTIDIGESEDIHPKNKQDVGKRLALWALADTYGKDITPSGPLYKSHLVEDGKIRVSFDHAKNGLMIGKKEGLAPVAPDPASKIRWVEIAGEDRIFKPAETVIEGSDLLISSPDVPAPLAARYAFIQDPAGANLYNKEGLPASPFRTDSW